jgi:short subunit dehydrogenase-like uncharacterized protein
MSDDESATERDYDIVVYGASGFTGRLVVEYLARRYPVGDAVRWAVAGRNRDKLQGVVDQLDAGAPRPDILVVDSTDLAALKQMSARTKVVLTTVGPYAKYGNDLVSACVDTATDYCDLCGEVQWMQRMIDMHQDAASSSGARIIMSCGFDSIPSDIGVQVLQTKAVAQSGEPLPECRLLVRALKGAASGGTIASMLNAIDEAKSDKSAARALGNPYALNPAGDRSGPDGPDQSTSRYDRDAEVWTAPFVMATVNTRIVRRSNALLNYPYGRNFRYSESTIVGTGLGARFRAMLMSLSLRTFIIASAIPLTRNIVQRFLPKPGEGPSRDARENGYFNLLLVGRLASGELLKLRVKGDKDPGYGSTSQMLAETAVCLASGECAVPGGFWTPSSALGGALKDRLERSAGLSFEFE